MTGTLDNPEAFPPNYHVWVSHKLAIIARFPQPADDVGGLVLDDRV